MTSPASGLTSNSNLPQERQLRKSLSFSEKLADHLSATDTDCDVVFSVGPEGEKIRAIRLVLVVSSPVFKYLFEDSWDHLYHTISHEGIPLPDLDPESFRIFLKLLLWDDVGEEKLNGLKLSPKNMFNLVEISKKYGMADLQASLETLVEQFFKSINKFVNSDEFLSLPRSILGSILSRDALPMDEVAVFQCAIRWAEYQCIAHGFEQSGANIRGMLDDYLYSIRFPVMSIKDFGNRVCPANILTSEEELKVFKYISTAEKDRAFFNVASLPFSVHRRKRCDPLVISNSANSGSPNTRQSQVKVNATASAAGVPGRSIWSGKRITRSETSVQTQSHAQGQGQGGRGSGGDGDGKGLSCEKVSHSVSVLSQTPTRMSLDEEKETGGAGDNFEVKQKPKTAAPKRKLAGAAAKKSTGGKASALPMPPPSMPSPGCSSQKRLVPRAPATDAPPRKKSDELPLSSNLADGAFVKITYKWNCGKVSLCADEDSPQYDVLEDLLGKYAKSAPPMDRVPEMNEIVVVPDNRGRYYRGVVTGFRGEDGVKIEFLDYGGETMVDSVELRELNEEINSFPIFAIKFRLKDVPENALNVNVGKNTEVENAIKNGCRMEVSKKGAGVWTGKLWVSETRCWSDIILDAIKSNSVSGRKEMKMNSSLP